MKQKLLLMSAGMTGTAVIVGIISTLTTTNSILAVRVMTVDVILILGSIGLFFVGLVYPKKED